MELLWENLFDAIKTQLERGNEHLYIMSPFITKGILKNILPDNISATIITAWQPDFIAKNIDSIDVYFECKERPDTALYLNPRLHAKLYAVDLTQSKNSAIVGSANLTRKGLGLDSKSNYEVACIVDTLSPKGRIYFQRILNDSILITNEIYEQYKEWVDRSHAEYGIMDEPNIDYVKKIQFLVTDLPLTDSPTRLWELKSKKIEFEWWEEDALIHDLSNFGGENAESKEVFFHELKNNFSNKQFIKEFLKNIDSDGLFFGRIKEWIQNNCHDVPTPKRRELTVTVQALLQWIVELFPEDFEIIRPKHSECLRMKQ